PGAALGATEQTNLSLHGAGFSVSDVDEAGGGAVATLNVGEGTITVVVGSSGVTVTGGTNGTGNVTLSGTIAQINNLLTGAGTGTITYLNNLDAPSASTTFTVTVNDQGNTGNDPGAGGTGTLTTEEGTNNVTINVTAMNDAPVVTAPGAALGATEQTNLSLHGTGFSVTDADEAGGGAVATLNVGEGTITVVAGTSGVTVTGGTNGTDNVTLSGTIAQLNNLLTGVGTGTITYLNSSDTPSAATTFTVTVNDQGNTGNDPGAGGTGTLTTEEGTNNATITITAMNDAPTVNAPGAALGATEQTNLLVHGTGFSVSDADEAGGGAIATLSVGEGTVTVVAGTSGVTITGGNGTGAVTLTGTIAQINNLLTGAGTGTITYLNGLDNPSVSTTFTVTVNDQGNTGNDPGAGGTGTLTTEEGSNTVAVTIAAVNDDPFNAGGVPSDLSVAIDTSSSLDLSSLEIADADVTGADLLTVTLSTSTGGALYANSSGGVAVVTAPGANLITLTGTLSDLNSYLDSGNVAYLHSIPGTVGDNADTIQVSVNDNGNNGTGGGLNVVLGSINIDIVPYNLAPVVVGPATLDASAGSNTALTGLGFGVTDADAGSAVLRATLTVGQGTLVVSSGNSGVSVVSGNGTNQIRLSGQASALDALLSGASSGSIVYTVDGGASGATTLSVVVNDQGNSGFDPGVSGDGASEEATLTVNITIESVTPPDVLPPVPPPSVQPPDPAPPVDPVVLIVDPETPDTTVEPGDHDVPSVVPILQEATAPAPESVATDVTNGEVGRTIERDRVSVDAIEAQLTKLLIEQLSVTIGITDPGGLQPLILANQAEFDRALDDLADLVNSPTGRAQVMVVTSVALSTGLSVGYVAWLLRGGALLASFLSTMPAWRLLDPLPILATMGAAEHDDSESLDGMLERSQSSSSKAEDRDRTAVAS
ncbi:MAG: hypothetical protein AAF493_06235, partial [Pseudomonadota bacterium]